MTTTTRLLRCVSRAGFVASTEARTNYRRVWGRDGCICGLAALVSDEPELVEATRRTLDTLARHQGPSGQIPSNVSEDGQVSYGGTAGRVDATIWFVLTACLFGRLVDDEALARWWPAVERAERVLRAWEHNDGGLVYVPVSGDWADEYVLDGYLLYDQVLRLWAAREWHASAERLGRERRGARAPELVERRIIEAFTEVDGQGHLIAGFHAGARHEMFDALGHALYLLLEVGPEQRRRIILRHAESVTRHDLVPAFWPPIAPEDPRYAALERAAAEHLRNRPGRYHNGGLWPMVTGFWAAAARRLGETDLADRWATGVAAANRAHDDPEYLDAHSGEPAGTRGQAWSAAAELLAGGLGDLLPP